MWVVSSNWVTTPVIRLIDPQPTCWKYPPEVTSLLGPKWMPASNGFSCHQGVQARKMPLHGHVAEQLHTPKALSHTPNPKGSPQTTKEQG